MTVSADRAERARAKRAEKRQQIKRAMELQRENYSNAEIAKELGISENEVRGLLIEWGQNCLTSGIHHGRDGTLWNIPLGYAVIIFRRQYLKDLVIARIYSDAMQFVEYGGRPNLTKAWADRIKEIAEERYDNALQTKVGEISQYYKTPGWELEQQEAARRVLEDKLNPHYEPLHGHDTINLLCRIIGSSASRQASHEMESQ